MCAQVIGELFGRDFLSPLPARSGFEENDDWIALLDFYFKLHARAWKKSTRGKQRAAPAGAEQETLELTERRPDNTLRP